jgi:hypothetical protein
MANVVKIKHSGTASSVPNYLEHGELAINYSDAKLFYRDSSNNIVSFNLVDPASSIATLTDVSLSSLQNGQILKYNSSNENWYNDYEILGNVDGGDAASNFGGIESVSGGGAAG